MAEQDFPDPQDPLADPQGQREVARLYRELPREEPSAALDAAILAEARSAAIMHPAPLVPPTGRRSWHFPLAAAAVIVLAVAVTWHVERAQPDPAASDGYLYKRSEESAPAASAQAPEASEKKSAPERALRDAAPKAARERERPRSSVGAVEPAAPPAEPPASAPEAPRAERQAPAVEAPPSAAEVKRDRRMAESAPAPQAAPAPAPQAGIRGNSTVSTTLGKLAEESPEPWLERIARLRRQGLHDEADKALAEFRKRYPDYKIPEAMLEKVEKK